MREHTHLQFVAPRAPTLAGTLDRSNESYSTVCPPNNAYSLFRGFRTISELGILSILLAFVACIKTGIGKVELREQHSKMGLRKPAFRGD